MNALFSRLYVIFEVLLTFDKDLFEEVGVFETRKFSAPLGKFCNQNRQAESSTELRESKTGLGLFLLLESAFELTLVLFEVTASAIYLMYS